MKATLNKYIYNTARSLIKSIGRKTNTAPVSNNPTTICSHLLEKHQNIINVVCCPNCHSNLTYSNTEFFANIPIIGIATCENCGIVAQIANFKILFNLDKTTTSITEKSIYDGEIQINPFNLDRQHFSKKGGWKHYDQRHQASKKGAKLILRHQSLAISLIFLKHPWSGKAKISVNGKLADTVDLFEEKGSMSLWYPIHLSNKNSIIEVEVTGEKNSLSNDSQVWIIGAETLELHNSTKPKLVYPSRNDGNPYPDCFSKLVENTSSDGLILDCGSGDRSYPDSRVVNFEYSIFRSPDVFGDGHKLPFKDNSFDLVLSQAVIEHLHDPFTAVSEIYRVLKPGGTVYAESAFIQPLHAVPYHFFNTTAWGLEHLFKQFEIQEIKHEGQLANTLTWFYSLTELKAKGLGKKVNKLLEIAKELDSNISNDELKNFASYVSLLAKKK